MAEQFVRLSKINGTQSATETTMRAQLRMLRALSGEDSVNDAWRDQGRKMLVGAVDQAIKKYPDSLPLQNEYADTQFLMITRWGQDDAEATKKRMESATKTLSGFAAKNPSVLATLRRLQVHKERFESAKPVETMVGKPAPAWDIDGMVNSEDDVTLESMKGKVVVLDFWAMWCGPCIATFPHLKQWREEYGEKGFEIVGVTQYYNYQWDEEKKRASRAQEDVSTWEERDTLKSFLDHHKLKHPVIVNPKESEMSSDYGVRGIPHVVLIDQEGVVQLVKTGAGKATAEEIEAKIKELLK